MTSVAPLRRRSYRRVLGEARALGVPEEDIAFLVAVVWRGQNPDPDDVRDALKQYVPVLAFHAGYEDEDAVMA